METRPYAARIAAPEQQRGKAEANAARLLHQSGLADVIAGNQKSIVFEVSNGAHLPLRISRYGNQLYLTSYIPGQHGQKSDTESRVVFYIRDNGMLSLKKIDLENSRGQGPQIYSRKVAEAISSQLLTLGYDDAARQSATQVEVETDQEQQSGSESDRGAAPNHRDADRRSVHRTSSRVARGRRTNFER